MVWGLMTDVDFVTWLLTDGMLVALAIGTVATAIAFVRVWRSGSLDEGIPAVVLGLTVALIAAAVVDMAQLADGEEGLAEMLQVAMRLVVIMTINAVEAAVLLAVATWRRRRPAPAPHTS